MSTKQHPGPYDCYAKLAEDEPYFLLRAKDPDAPFLVRLWLTIRRRKYGDYPKLHEAALCAETMEAWQRAHPEAQPTVPDQATVQVNALKDRLRSIAGVMRANPEHRVRSYVQEIENLLS